MPGGQLRDVIQYLRRAVASQDSPMSGGERPAWATGGSNRAAVARLSVLRGYDCQLTAQRSKSTRATTAVR